MGRVAIIEDFQDLLELLEFILGEEHGLRIYDRPTVFLREFRPGAFDVVLLDLVMPDLDGFEAFRRIRELDPEVPVIAITGLARPEERERAFQAGFSEYIVKPIVDLAAFRETVYRHVPQSTKPSYGAPPPRRPPFRPHT